MMESWKQRNGIMACVGKKDLYVKITGIKQLS